MHDNILEKKDFLQGTDINHYIIVACEKSRYEPFRILELHGGNARY